MKDRGMIMILYLKTWSDIGSPTQSSLQFKVFQSGRPFLASGHGRLLLLPWSVLATQNCTAVNQSLKTFGRQQGGDWGVKNLSTNADGRTDTKKFCQQGKFRQRTNFFARQFYTLYEQNLSNLKPLLSITFPPRIPKI